MDNSIFNTIAIYIVRLALTNWLIDLASWSQIIELIDIEGSRRLLQQCKGWSLFEDTIYIVSVPVIEYKSSKDGFLYTIR